MQNQRWWKPLLAFLITFGALTLAASVVRAVAVYRQFYALGMQTDDPAVADRAAAVVAQMDAHYTPIFLLVATAVSAVAAGIVARRRAESR